jgi:multisubunit Na+/H+ antiporter MnhE subunit
MDDFLKRHLTMRGLVLGTIMSIIAAIHFDLYSANPNSPIEWIGTIIGGFFLAYALVLYMAAVVIWVLRDYPRQPKSKR